ALGRVLVGGDHGHCHHHDGFAVLTAAHTQASARRWMMLCKVRWCMRSGCTCPLRTARHSGVPGLMPAAHPPQTLAPAAPRPWEPRSLQRLEVLRDLAQVRLGIVRALRGPSELLALDLGEAKSIGAQRVRRSC